jgi:2-polyprenyl-3-methyl-5-hydroxy-6-metoxy-1,4-benzoquinol methylase
VASAQLWNANIQYHALLLEAIPLGARRVLDVGCGDGILAAQLAQAGVPHVVALDVDGDVLDRARARHRGVAVQWQRGDIFDVALVERRRKREGRWGRRRPSEAREDSSPPGFEP